MSKYPNKNPVTMTDDMFEAYKEFRDTTRFYNGRFHISNDFVLAMKKATKDIKDNYYNNGGRVLRNRKNKNINNLYLEIINALNKKYSLDNLDEYGEKTIKFELNKFDKTIRNTSGYRDTAKIRQIRDEILDLLGLRKIQIGRSFYVVTKYYEEENDN